uniref:Uncharacterized protein n=1 Tax=Cacopsylla melanoneura TaxID=428564 RepID=A0A8D9EKZ5_9HEMI
MTLPCIYIYQCILFIQKYYEEFFKCSEIKHQYKTREANTNTLNTIRTKYNYIQNSPTQKMITIYNKFLKLVKDKDKNIPNINTYIKELLLNEAFYNINDFLTYRPNKL